METTAVLTPEEETEWSLAYRAASMAPIRIPMWPLIGPEICMVSQAAVATAEIVVAVQSSKSQLTAAASVLHIFSNIGVDGWEHVSLTIDRKDDLYGATFYGGTSNAGGVFKVKSYRRDTSPFATDFTE
jgi:hypothetical protein